MKRLGQIPIPVLMGLAGVLLLVASMSLLFRLPIAVAIVSGVAGVALSVFVLPQHMRRGARGGA